MRNSAKQVYRGVLVDFLKVKYVRKIYSNVTHQRTSLYYDIDFLLTLQGCTNLNIHYKSSNETTAKIFFPQNTEDKYRNEIMQKY